MTAKRVSGLKESNCDDYMNTYLSFVYPDSEGNMIREYIDAKTAIEIQKNTAFSVSKYEYSNDYDAYLDFIAVNWYEIFQK